jgi:hypothetical protein
MRLPFAARDIPGRVVTGGYILHTGISKWNGTPETAAALHGAAAAAFPFLKDIPPEKFLRTLAAGEIATGATLLLPLMPSKVAGLALSGFSGALAHHVLAHAGYARAWQHLADPRRNRGQQGRLDARHWPWAAREWQRQGALRPGSGRGSSRGTLLRLTNYALC